MKSFVGLKAGDMVRHVSGGGTFIVMSNYGSRVTAVKSADLTKPNEWVRVDVSGNNS